MRPAPTLSRIPAFPVITVVAAMAIFVTIAIKTGRTDIEPFTMSSVAFDNEPWRLLSSALPHGDAIHLIFNVVWLWVLGTRLEETLGHITTFVIIIVLAVGSSAAEFAFAAGGIGLSGVGYGLVGCLMVLARHDRRFRDAIDRNTLILFGAWFVLCVVLTLADVWNIGNVAHGSGFVLGVIIGYVIAPGTLARRIAAGGALVIVVAASLAGAALFRPQLNLSAY
ncbi:MAG TPA: rhomboid family intramembrane serine protease, partial [Kofleriaceae bacterium]|nr:rhomboid family intramembrane serine protease [Kofleriaceae bacterium]